jgi:muramoyltetrapeptide carboxypeptidase LdcA involved in peptidoglycan recycling
MIAATRFGKPLPDGGTVGVAAAASPYDSRSDVRRGVEWWEERGYRVKLADGVWDRDDYVAGDARRRGEDLNTLLACLRGRPFVRWKPSSPPSMPAISPA